MKRAWAIVLALAMAIQMYGVIHQYDIQPTEISTILASNDSLLLATHISGCGIQIYDCTDPYNLVHHSMISGSYQLVRLKGDHVYCRGPYFTVFDIHDYDNPEVLVTIDTNNYHYGNHGNSWGVEEYNDRLYISWSNTNWDGENRRSWEIWDIADLTNPVLIESVYCQSYAVNDCMLDLRIQDDIAYQLVDVCTDLIVFDISNPDEWVVIDNLALPLSCWSMIIREDTIYLYRESRAARIDISDPYNTSMTGIVSIDGIYSLTTTIMEDLLVLNTYNGMVLYSTENPDSLEYYGRYDEVFDTSLGYVLPVDYRCYAYPNEGYMHYIDCHGTGNIYHINSLTDCGNLDAFTIKDNELFVLPYRCYDISDPYNPVCYYASYEGNDIIVRENTAFVCDPACLGTYDISDISNISMLDHYYIGSSENNFLEVALSEDTIYGITEDGMLVYDVEDVENIELLANYSTTTRAEHIRLYNDCLYTWSEENGLFVYSIEIPNNPQEHYSYFPGTIRAIEFFDEFLYILSDDYLLIYTNDGQGNLSLQSEFYLMFTAEYEAFRIKGNVMILADNLGRKLSVYNISNPVNPRLDFNYSWNYETYEMQLTDEYLIADTGGSGIQILNIEALKNGDEVMSKPSFALSNHPNPFNPTTTISFSLPEAGSTELSIYNIRGQRVKTLVRDYLDVGDHSFNWDGTDDRGTGVSSGVYLYRIRSGKLDQCSKMLLMK